MAFRDEFLRHFRWIEGHADIVGLFADAELLAGAIDALAEPFAREGVTKVAGIEARAFILGGGVARSLGAGFVAVRKQGSIHPGAKAERTTAPDWRGYENVLRVQRETLGRDDKILLVDDWAETGSQAIAARALIEDCGATYAGLSLLVDQLSDDVRRSLVPVRAVVRAEELPAAD
ncbi:MAG TPA: phosphoribosyltransferase family protein [Gaiellaceae bacterium]